METAAGSGQLDAEGFHGVANFHGNQGSAYKFWVYPLNLTLGNARWDTHIDPHVFCTNCKLVSKYKKGIQAYECLGHAHQQQTQVGQLREVEKPMHHRTSLVNGSPQLPCRWTPDWQRKTVPLASLRVPAPKRHAGPPLRANLSGIVDSCDQEEPTLVSVSFDMSNPSCLQDMRTLCFHAVRGIATQCVKEEPAEEGKYNKFWSMLGLCTIGNTNLLGEKLHLDGDVGIVSSESSPKYALCLSSLPIYRTIQ